MPAVHYRLRWPDASVIECYSPSTVIRDYLRPHTRYALDDFTWRWAFERSPRVRALAAPDARPRGLSALWRGQLWCDLGFAWTLCTHVAVSLGARGILRVDEGRKAVLLAVSALPALD